jgi:hypothetical protein
MTTAIKTYDVFISHSVADRDIARMVARNLESVGLITFHLEVLESGESASEEIWQALAESHAVIAIVSNELSSNANVTLEIGAAAAWNKPVYLIVKDPKSTQLTGILQSYPSYPLSRLDDVIRAIQTGFQPLSETDYKALGDVYRKVGVSTDQLSQSSESLRTIASEFQQRTRKAYSGERLLYELFRMRKSGKLPRLTTRRA